MDTAKVHLIPANMCLVYRDKKCSLCMHVCMNVCMFVYVYNIFMCLFICMYHMGNDICL